MAEDKRIRVSADASPLQELRQNAQALWNDFNKMESEFKNIAEQTVGVIQKQIDLLKERNAFAGGMQGGLPNDTPTERRPTLIDPYTGRPLSGGGGAVTPGTSGRALNTQLTERQQTTLDKILSEVVRIADLMEKTQRDDTNGVLPTGSGGEPPQPPQPPAPEPPDVPTPGQGSGSGMFGKGFKMPTSMSGLMGMLPFGALIMGIGTILGQQAKYESAQYGAENEFQRRNNRGNHWLLNMLTFGISGAEAQKKEVGRMAAAQNDRVLNRYASLHNLSYQGALASQLTNSFDEERIEAVTARDEDKRENGGFLNAVGKFGMRIVASEPHVAWESREQMFDELDRKEQISKNAKAAEERAGGEVSDKEYHTWASETLGLNITDYIEKVVNLQRAGVYEKNTSMHDMNQLLMAGRIRGLSEEDAASVLATTRFDRSGRTGANVVQAFDTNLQGLGKSDQYIASTLGEYLGAFNRTAEKVLERVGTINTANIVSSMTSIQNATGMEGRQLERVQNSLMGNSISQDEVTQALLMRAARKVSGPNARYSDIKAAIEDMPNNIELQKELFDLIQRMTGGGEVGRFVMQHVYQRSMSDIIKLEKKTDLDGEKLFKSGRSKGGEYSEENARSKAGPAERSSAGTTNRKVIDYGYSDILDKEGTSLKAVLESIEKPIPVMIVQVPANSAGAPLPPGFIGPPTMQQMSSAEISNAVFVGVSKAIKNLTITQE